MARYKGKHRKPGWIKRNYGFAKAYVLSFVVS